MFFRINSKKSLVFSLVFLSSLGMATSYPLTIRDDLNRTVVIKVAPKRIVSLAPANTEILFAIGAGNRVVGRDDYSDYPKEALNLPKLGGLYNPNLEAIVALKPDLVINSEYGTLTPALEKAGITVWAGTAQTYSDIFNTVNVLGKIVGEENKALQLNAKIKTDIAKIERITNLTNKIKTYFEIDPSIYTVGPNSYIGTLITKAGGTNIIPKNLGDFPKINPELVIINNPDVMIGLNLNEAKTRPGWNNINAIKNNKVYALSAEESGIISRAGPRVAEALRILVQKIHPELFNGR